MSSLEAAAYLWQSAHTHAHTSPALSRVLSLGMHDVVTRASLALPARAEQRRCAACFSLLAPGFNCAASHVAHKRRPAARRLSLRVRCGVCGHTAEFASAPRPSGRTSRAPAPAPAPKARTTTSTKRSRAEAPAASRKKPPAKPPRAAPPQRAAAAAAAAPASTSDALFGFDFVPL